MNCRSSATTSPAASPRAFPAVCITRQSRPKYRSPDHGDAEERLQWIGRTEWEYRCGFDWAGAGGARARAMSRAELVLDGLDTVTEIALNGQVVGRAESFFFPHRFDVDHAIRAPGR